MGANFGSDLIRCKEALLKEIKQLDNKADFMGLSHDGWTRRYAVEEEMIFVLTCEEMYWQLRGQEKWVLKGDASTEFFHAVANECRRRCMIRALSDGKKLYVGKTELRAHIDTFYIQLLGTTSGGAASLGPDMWEPQWMVSREDNHALIRPFTLVEVTTNLNNMRVNTAPGPDGFPVIFYKKF